VAVVVQNGFSRHSGREGKSNKGSEILQVPNDLLTKAKREEEKRYEKT